MRILDVQLEDGLNRDGWRGEEIASCMEELIRRFQISGLNIVGLGSGTGNEESHFQASNELTIVDIDEGGTLTAFLQKLPVGRVKYHVLDATKSPLDPPQGGWDLIYLSGFTPDELRRTELRNRDGSWRKGTRPFHPILDFYAQGLSERGRLIIQSFVNAGNDIFDRRFHVEAAKQAKSWSMVLEELYYYRKAEGVRLFVYSKPGAPSPVGAPLTRFHGRSTILDEDEVCPFVLGGKAPRVASRLAPSNLLKRIKTTVYDLFFRKD